jgi:hypothetical protein
MMERGDFQVFHEPFSYFYYVDQGKGSITQEYIEPDHPTSYAAIRQMLLEAGDKGRVFFKDMAAHCASRLLEDVSLLRRVRNTFLIRDPAKTIPSFFALNPELTMAEIGCEQLASLFEAAREKAPQPPVVVDADDLEDDPAGIVAAYCDALDIGFLPAALHWKPELPRKWKMWQKWHADAAGSTGIRKNLETFEVTIDNNERLRRYYDHHLPFYRRMHRHRIAAVEV